jgi:hypothetical protein
MSSGEKSYLTLKRVLGGPPFHCKYCLAFLDSEDQNLALLEINWLLSTMTAPIEHYWNWSVCVNSILQYWTVSVSCDYNERIEDWLANVNNAWSSMASVFLIVLAHSCSQFFHINITVTFGFFTKCTVIQFHLQIKLWENFHFLTQ